MNEKQSNTQLLEREVAEGRKRCAELEEELDQVNKEIGDARVSPIHLLCTTNNHPFPPPIVRSQ